jgi:tetratricopeptide (TPR) repeat protein
MPKYALVVMLLFPEVALAQRAPREIEVNRGPAQELYIRKRPPTPEAPILSKELKSLLASTEKKRDDKRLEAIGLLRGFLQSKPTGESKAEGMFKLAELLWEEARRTYLIRMDEFSRGMERCSQKKGCEQPKEPRIDLKEAEALYIELHDKFPNFRRMDLVTYLVGFAAKEDQREPEAMAKFQEVIDRFPNSPLIGDAWMMRGEHYFQAAEWKTALDAYTHIKKDAATYDLAMFKRAWCEWKLGMIDEAKMHFVEVLNNAIELERRGTEAQRRRSASLRDEALEYLVVVFTEDRSVSAKDVFDFLASIGGEQFSGDILKRVADSYAAQAEWDRSADAFRFLIRMEPDSIKAADYQRRIVENWNTALDPEKAQDEIKVLLDKYGPGSAWAKAQKDREALDRSLDTTEQLARQTATNLHGEAQRREKGMKLPKPTEDGCQLKPQVPGELKALYTRAADAYDTYLEAFGTGKKSAEGAIEIRYYRADILCFKLGKVEEAGDEYLAVGKSAPVGKLHKDALLNAMSAFEKARPKDTVGRKQLYPVDKKFGEAIDLYATLFKGDRTIVGVLFKNGQMFYDYGEYDEAIKRFGVIVTKYPEDQNAGPAGDRILSALNKAQDYENIETWARKLKAAGQQGLKGFASKEQQERLDTLIVESINKSGQKYADAGKYEQAATFYLRVPKETSNAQMASTAMMNAGVMYEKAKQLEKAADLYLDIAEKYGDKNQEIGEKAAFNAGSVYEKVIYYERAAKAYELVYAKFGKGSKAADALFNAGVLRQALGQHEKAIAHYKDYANKFKERKDAPDVAFNIGVVYEEAGQDGPAYQAFADYARVYKSSGKHVIEALARAGRASYKLGQHKRSKDEFAQVEHMWKSATGKDKQEGKQWAAEARYYGGELVFAEFEKISFTDVKPSLLTKTLEKKAKLLAESEKAYGTVIDAGDAKWATAALFRVGQVYDKFGEALVEAAAKPPKGLPPDQVQAYQDAINNYVVQMQDKAVELYTAGYQKAIQLQLYDANTAKIREALGRVARQKFPPEHESRSRERTGDRPPTPELVIEVAR